MHRKETIRELFPIFTLSSRKVFLPYTLKKKIKIIKTREKYRSTTVSLGPLKTKGDGKVMAR